MANFQVLTSDFVNLHISTSKQNDVALLNEKRFAKDLTIENLKAKLELITGGNCKTMQLEVYNKNKELVCKLSDGNALLGSYPIDDGMRLHVIDAFNLVSDVNLGGDFGSGEAVEHFKLSEEDYTKKKDTLRSFLLNNKLGHYNEEYIKKKHQQELEEQQICENIKVGMRCKVAVEGAPQRLGTIMYVGLVEELPSTSGKYWIGVKYDEPLGKNDGSVKGKRYFECPPKYGGFVKPQKVTIGDFPPVVDDNLDLNEEI